eukprot:TRINITY_DN90_c0_g3_i1.p1 TRINITY_DN90_c0_g3~~TRINITY_DN90_c0_g3_i1.p1  ORF type:complete len:347 (+),score=154.42 TRINITY_DN90_c0_g3_i1:66-1106(+)
MTTKADDIMALIEARKADEKCLTFTYASESKLTKKVQTEVKLANPAGGAFTFTVDEPETMPGGSNAGPNPLDVVCASLGTCQEITYKLYATVMQVPVKSVSASVTGDINLCGFVGLADKIGFDKVAVEIKVDAPDATDEQLAALKGAVDTHCPLLSTLTGEVPITTEIAKSAASGTSDAKDLTEGVMGVIGAGKKDSAALKMQYSSQSTLAGAGLKTDVTLPGGHTMVVDEPENMPGGTNKGPNPIDLFCAAVGTCQEITYKYYAGVMGLACDSVSCKVEAPIDLGGLVGLADDAVALKTVAVKVDIATDATDEQVEALKKAVDAHCPLVDTLKTKTPVTTALVRA